MQIGYSLDIQKNLLYLVYEGPDEGEIGYYVYGDIDQEGIEEMKKRGLLEMECPWHFLPNCKGHAMLSYN